jgi:hypothetical protein
VSCAAAAAAAPGTAAAVGTSALSRLGLSFRQSSHWQGCC